MARISGVDLPREKRIEIGLTYVYGIGRVRASPIKGITIFSGRRRLESLKGDYCPHEVRAYVFNVNVCDIIPRRLKFIPDHSQP